MKVLDTEIAGLKIIEPQVLGDSRGWFAEQYNAGRYREAGITADFVQDNESFSRRGVVRGLQGSPTFGRHVAVTLTGENKRQFFIPRGFAHGFIVLEDETLFSYKCDNLYCPSADRGLRFDDPALGIVWPAADMRLTLSEKDSRNPLLKDIEPWAEE